MNNAQVVEHLGLTYKFVEAGSLQTVMSAPVPFFLYNPAFLTAPEMVPEYMTEATTGADGRYQIPLFSNPGRWEEAYSKLVVLTEAEAARFKEHYAKSMELHTRGQITGPVYNEMLDEFDALLASFEHRASMFDPELPN